VQPDLFLSQPVKIAGETFDPVRDGARLASQFHRVFTLMADGKPRSLAEISEATGASEAAASARLRDFRKAEHGAHTVERYHVGKGLWKYKLVINQEAR
jgi:hypothetical protein